MKPISYGQSDRGLERDENEDSFAISDELGIYVVADGMGGHSGGKVASDIAVNTVIEFLARYVNDRDFTWPVRAEANLSKEENLLYAAIKWANRQVFNYSMHKKNTQEWVLPLLLSTFVKTRRLLGTSVIRGVTCYAMVSLLS